MAGIKSAPDNAAVHKVTCDLPKCLERRKGRGQQNGRFMFSYEFGAGTVTVQVPCPECGGTHSVMIAIPPEALPVVQPPVDVPMRSRRQASASS
jgi:hypothetical protein